jgi:biopolymer transport protein ExbD
MKHLPFTLALLLASLGLCALKAQTPPMQRGISVQLASTDHASPLAEADQPSAWVVTVTADGGVYFGTKSVTPEGLYYAMKARARKFPKELFVKVDERAPYGTVEHAIENVHRYFSSVMLLTGQPGASASDRSLMPQGFEVLIDSPGGSGPSINLDANQVVRVNSEQVPTNLLAQTLRNLTQDNKDTIIPIEANEKLPFGDVAHAIDICTGLGTRVDLKLPSQ